MEDLKGFCRSKLQAAHGENNTTLSAPCWSCSRVGMDGYFVAVTVMFQYLANNIDCRTVTNIGIDTWAVITRVSMINLKQI